MIERNNHTLKEMDICMMYSQDLPPIFQIEEVNYANYIQTHTSHRDLDHMTLEEVWSKTKPDVSYF